MDVMLGRLPVQQDEKAMFLAAADRIGHQLCRDALWQGDRCSWGSWAMGPVDGQFLPVYRTIGTDLYDGVAGIALFLGRLYAKAPGPRLRATLHGAVAQCLARLEADSAPRRGFYTGRLGIAYALTEIAAVLGADGLMRRAGDIAAAGCRDPFPDDALDLIGGAASAIPALILLGRRHQRPELVEAALLQADRLCQAAVKDERGLSWAGVLPRRANLVGYAHGTSGMAAALLEAHSAGGDDHLRVAALEAVRYERSWFDAAQGGWPDFRLDPGSGVTLQSPLSCNCTWCNGAVGIGLMRLRLLELLPQEPQALAEVDVALQAVARFLALPMVGPTADCCLCHGLAGAADFVLAAGVQLQRDDVTAVARQTGRFAIDQYQAPGLPWPCGVQGRGEAPGLLTGIAGIGYFFLRLESAGALDSVLMLRP